ncbi:MAG: tetratricopeptide repeat protein [Chloroflexi bacterium]|nr:tetratricopeptide repeat protein [Chloroflexota bacterium]
MADHSEVGRHPSVLPESRLVLSLLGAPQVLLSGRVVIDQRFPKVLALLAYLALEAHRPHSRIALAGLLWPELPEARAFQDLRQTLARLRRAICDQAAGPPHLLADPQTIQFNLQGDCWNDVAAFKTLLAETQGHRHRRLDACPTCISQLAQASAYYRGDFLADLYVPDSPAFEEWLMVEREALRRLACTAFHALASAHLARGQPELTRQYARRLLQLDPWNEPAHRLMLRALASSEGRTAALQHYQAFHQALAAELGVEPEDETVALIGQIRDDALADARPRAPTSHLPAPDTPLVGREAERKQINDMLASQDRRLLTLCGPGGIGKTRLALEIAGEQAALWRDGVWFVPLSEVSAPEQLVDALAAALHLNPSGASLNAAQLIEILRRKELLLILDSFERLTDSASLLQDILRWAPEISFLITSRARLGLQGEWAIALEGLDVPPLTIASVTEAQTYSAVLLLAQCARRVDPTFTLSPENVPHVIRICRSVAGLPLGIKLAAAWVRLLPCQQIADEIEQSLDFLQDAEASNLERQRSLRASCEYSYRLLSEAEQRLFRKLSVFSGGFTVDVARQVTGSAPSSLASLLDKSLLQVSPLDLSSSGRLDLHLTLKQFAAEKLAQVSGEEMEARARHGRAYLAFVQKREQALWVENSKETLDEMNVELGNVRAAWRWALSQGEVEEIDASIRGLSRFYDLRGLFPEAASVFESAAVRVLALGANNIAAQRIAGRLLAEQARFLSRQALYAQVVQVAQAAVRLAQASQDTLYEASATWSWGEALWRQGEYEQARSQLEHALFLVRAARDFSQQSKAPLAGKPLLEMTSPADRFSQMVEMDSLNSLGGLRWIQGDHAGAAVYLEQALRIAVNSSSRKDEAKLLMNLGVFAVEQGKYAEAQSMFQQSLRIQRTIGSRRSESLALGNLGNMYLYLGNYSEAKTYYEQALHIQRETGAQADEAITVGNLGLVYHYLEQDEIARDHSQQALAIAQRIGDRRAQGAMWMKLGHALAGLRQLDQAAHAYQESVNLRRDTNSHNVAMESLAGLAHVVLTQGYREQAQAYVEEILSHLETSSGRGLDGTINPMQVYLTCYQVLRANGDARAEEILTTAHDLVQRRAAKIEDAEMRRSFLENVAAHRTITREWTNKAPT